MESTRCNAENLLLHSLASSLHLQRVRRRWPLSEAPAARYKLIRKKFREWRGDKKARLWNSPSFRIEASLLKIRAEKAVGVIFVPDWPRQISYTRFLLDSKAVVRVPLRPQLSADLFTTENNLAWGVIVATVGGPSLSKWSAELGQPRQALQEVLQVCGMQLMRQLLLLIKLRAVSGGSFLRFAWMSDMLSYLRMSASILLAYLRFLFEEDRVHVNSREDYVSTVRTLHFGSSHDDSFAQAVVHELFSVVGEGFRDAFLSSEGR